LYWESFKQMPNWLPPIEEQRAICEFIQNETRALDATLSRLDREIELLREYRTRLAADVVTGKFDVREAAARLPDEAPPEAEALDEIDTLDEVELPDEEVAA
jgi:type I restriction enzyme S subunit